MSNTPRVIDTYYVEQGLTFDQTHYRSYGGTGFYGSNDPTNSDKALKEDRSYSLGLGFNPIRSTHRAHNNTTTMQYEIQTHKILTDKHK